MPFTTPPSFTSGAVLTAAQLNTLGDDLNYLYAQSQIGAFYGVRLSRSTTQAISDSTDTNISFDVEGFDIGSWIAVPASTLIVPAAAIPTGYTTIALCALGAARFAANGTGTRRLSVIHAGTEEGAQSVSAVSGETTNLVMNTVFTAAAGDAITMRVYQSSGGSLNVSADTAKLTVYRIGVVS